MERNANYPIADLKEIVVRLAWGQLELYADDIEQIQVIASGDATTLGDLRIVVREQTLTIEQPQYGLSLDITHGHWMQLCVRVPLVWAGEIRANSISGPISARGLGGGRIELETITGDLKAAKLTAGQISLRTTSGAIHGEQLITDRLSGRSVTGDLTLGDISARSCRFTTISGNVQLILQAGFEQMDFRTVSGNCSLVTPEDALRVSMRSVTGRRIADGVVITELESAPIIRATGVSGDLKIIGLRKA